MPVCNYNKRHKFKRLDQWDRNINWTTKTGVLFYNIESLKECYVKEIDPIFNKPGWFFDREEDKCWVEALCDGKIRAFLEENSNQFKYNLQVSEHRTLSDEEVKAIKVLFGHGQLNHLESPLKELLSRDYYWKENREAYRSSRKWSLSVMGETDEDDI